jgi:hypothetical protein
MTRSNAVSAFGNTAVQPQNSTFLRKAAPSPNNASNRPIEHEASTNFQLKKYPLKDMYITPFSLSSFRPPWQQQQQQQ